MRNDNSLRCQISEKLHSVDSVDAGTFLKDNILFQVKRDALGK